MRLHGRIHIPRGILPHPTIQMPSPRELHPIVLPIREEARQLEVRRRRRLRAEDDVLGAGEEEDRDVFQPGEVGVCDEGLE